MRNKYYVRQNGYKDCGPSCLLSIMKYYGCEASHEEVCLVLKTNEMGTTAYDIINGSRTFGFDGYGIHISSNDIFNNKMSFPIICHVKKDNMFHFIVIYGINKNKLYMMDPSSNKKTINIKDFENIYLRTSIYIYPVKNVKNEISKENIIYYFLSFIKLEKSKFIKLVIYSLVVILLGILSNYYSMLIIDYIIPNYNISIFLSISFIFLFTNSTY